jgi:hypothetical protein
MAKGIKPSKKALSAFFGPTKKSEPKREKPKKSVVDRFFKDK